MTTTTTTSMTTTTTQDTVLLLSSGKVPLKEGDLEDFEEKLDRVCHGLAEDVVRNGEGTAHVMQVCTYMFVVWRACMAGLVYGLWHGVAWYSVVALHGAYIWGV